jgi:hypothetical protein
MPRRARSSGTESRYLRHIITLYCAQKLTFRYLIQPGTLARVWLRSMQFYRGHVPIARLMILGGLRDKFVRFLGLFAIVLFVAG